MRIDRRQDKMAWRPGFEDELKLTTLQRIEGDEVRGERDAQAATRRINERAAVVGHHAAFDPYDGFAVRPMEAPIRPRCLIFVEQAGVPIELSGVFGTAESLQIVRACDQPEFDRGEAPGDEPRVLERADAYRYVKAIADNIDARIGIVDIDLKLRPLFDKVQDDLIEVHHPKRYRRAHAQ